jgi:hypothetical protein
MTTRRYPHQFRFQVIASWLADNYAPRRTLDVGGGKGLLAYLLNLRSWDVSVVDPVDQLLPPKYKDIITGKRILITDRAQVKRITGPFTEDMGQDFDLLIGLHAHGSNIKILEAAAKYHKDFLILPCCVIDEPIEVRGGINWMDSLEEYAKQIGLPVKRTTFNFVRQSTALYKIN